MRIIQHFGLYYQVDYRDYRCAICGEDIGYPHLYETHGFDDDNGGTWKVYRRVIR